MIGFAVETASQNIFEFEQQIEAVLREKHKNDHKTKGTMNFIRTKNISKIDDISLINNKEKLKGFLYNNAAILDYEKMFDSRKKMFDDFEKKVLSWYPHFSTFIKDFSKFLWRASVQKAELEKLKKNKSEFQSLISSHLSKFVLIPTDRKSVADSIRHQIYGIFKADYKIKPQSQLNSTYAAVVKSLDPKIFEQLDLLFHREKLKRLITDKCLKKLDNRVESTLDRAYKCMSKETCRRKGYFDAASRVEHLKSYAKNKNQSPAKITDEIDATIFDLIREDLKNRMKFDADKINCIVEFLMVKDATSAVYDPELFFNEPKLTMFIDGILLDYERLIEVI